jgi:hypothetical protein
MEETELQSLERFVAENDELLALEEQIGRFSIFDALAAGAKTPSRRNWALHALLVANAK